MPKHICILGIDGSDKSAIADSLSAILAGEINTVVGSAGDSFKIVSNDQDICGPDFYPASLPLSARLALFFRKLAGKYRNSRTLYAIVRFLNLFFQDAAARKIAEKNGVRLFVSDGNTLLSACGCQANYISDKNSLFLDAGTRMSRDFFSYAFFYLLVGGLLRPDIKKGFRKIREMRLFSRMARIVRCQGVWLPDLVIFLDIKPENALHLIRKPGKPVDTHENRQRIEQVRRCYRDVLRVFQDFSGDPGAAHIIRADELTSDQILRLIVNIIREHAVNEDDETRDKSAPTGITGEKTGKRVALIGKSLNAPKYLPGACNKGFWRKPLFFFSNPGRLFLKQGYSATVLKTICDSPADNAGVMERIFLNHPLHRAVYDRRRILARNVEPLIRQRLAQWGEVAIFTEPSGFADGLIQPLEAIAADAPEAMTRIRLFAADLDPRHEIEPWFDDQARRLGISLIFKKGDPASREVRDAAESAGPFDIVLFVGLSNSLSKRLLLSRLQWIRRHMGWDSLLVTDCFTPEAHAFSENCVGNKCHYYSPGLFRQILDYCGFNAQVAVVNSGRDRINHVVITCPHIVPSLGTRPHLARQTAIIT